MNINHGLVLLTLIFSFSNCLYLSEEEFKEIPFMTPTKFSIDHQNFSYFKYNISHNPKTVGLKFLEANSYTVNVKTYSSYEKKENETQYHLADEQFKEINVTGYGDYLYIVIEITKTNYSYDDYLTIYDSGKSIDLENNKVISINKFLSNNEYIFTYKPNTNKTIALFYNTQNFINNYRLLYICQEQESLIPIGKVDTYKETFNIIENNIFTVLVDIEFDKTQNQKQDFTLMIREIENNNINEILLNKRETINYIYNNDSQFFYFYANITDIRELNTLNFKFDYRYYKNINTKVSVLAKYVPLDEDIDKKELITYKPTENELIGSYDLYSDEYYRIYLNNKNQTSKYLYAIVSVEIKDESYYYGSKSIEFSMGEQEEIKDFTNINYNVAQKIEKNTLYYIPYYWKLKLDKNDVYLLGISNEHMFVSTFINGDLITADNKLNLNVSESNNEIIILKDKKELTIKLFGIKKDVSVYIERVKKDQFDYDEGERTPNRIFTLNMKENQTNYILGTFSYDDYAFGKLSKKYYATIDNGEFELLFSNIIGCEENHLFPTNKNFTQKFNEIINLEKHIDLFTIKCKKDGIMYIRPQFKEFDKEVRLIALNNYSIVNMSELNEIVQLTAPLGKRNETLYFAINLINSQKINNPLINDELSITITPDTKGTFENGVIRGNEIFYGHIDLNDFTIDQLAIALNASNFGAELEIVEVVHNNYTSYVQLNNTENSNLNSNNLCYSINNNKSFVIINFSNLKGKKISYVIIRSAIEDMNYITIAGNYPNAKTVEVNNDNSTINITNIYCNTTDPIKNHVYLLFSVNGQEDNLNYGFNIRYSVEQKSEPKNNTTTKIIIIVVIIIVIVLIVVGIILFNVISKRRRRSSTLIEQLGTIDSSENQLQ